MILNDFTLDLLKALDTHFLITVSRTTKYTKGTLELCKEKQSHKKSAKKIELLIHICFRSQ